MQGIQSCCCCCCMRGRAFLLAANVISLITCLLTSCGAEVQRAHGEKVGGPQGFTRKILRRSRAEDQVPVPGNQGGDSVDCFTAPVFKNGFLLCFGVRPFLPISLEERSSSRWGNECLGYLMTQEQWEKSKQSLSKIPSSMFPYLVLVPAIGDKLWIFCAFLEVHS